MNHESRIGHFISRFTFHVSRFASKIQNPKSKSSHYVALVLLLIFFAQVVTASRETSLTSDEGPQLTSGYSYLVTGDAHLIEFDGHPPFAKVLTALPLLPVTDLRSPASAPSWTSTDPISLVWVTQEFLYSYRPLDRLITAARLPVALWGVLLCALIYRWARDLFGPSGGVLALLLAVFDPNLLAHAGLATNDLPVTAACCAAIFTFWRCLRHPTPKRIILAGITLGLAQAIKLNAMLLLPIEGALVLLWAAREANYELRITKDVFHASLPKSKIQNLKSTFTFHVSRFILLLLVAAVTLWAAYGFEMRSLPGWPFPLPAGTHLLLFSRVADATGGGHPAFLMGEISTEGWWHYFPVAFALKTPLPTLLILTAAVGAFFLGRRQGWGDEIVLGLFPLLYCVATIASRLNIGYRHLLPVLPFLYVFAARIGGSASRRISEPANRRVSELRISRSTFHVPLRKSKIRNPKSEILFVLFLWLIAGTLLIWPFHLAFFNELIGGPDEGYHYLVDSNDDWGQSHKALRRYMEKNGIARVKLSTYIEFDAAMDWYGVTFEPLPPLHAAPGVLPSRFNPAPGVYAISSTTLQGIFTADPEIYDWFRKRDPDALVGHSLLIYRLPEDRVAGRWVAQCTVPAAPLPEATVAEGFGSEGLSMRYFDCTQSWIVPQGGQTPGWYVFFRDTTLDADRFIQANLAVSRLSFEQTRNTTVPPFAIYAAEATPGAPPATLAPAIPATTTLRVGDLTFLGHTVVQPQRDQPLEVWTFWRVDALVARPLSLMLHLQIPGTGQAVVGDGLGVPQTMWQVGDVMIQRHLLPLPADAPAGDYTLVTGAYWLDTQPPERWPVFAGGQKTGDQVSLSPASIVLER
ncbi:MAG: glycosyltransferase family 39 protein [Anaerolineae bacterium]|nr:glycosyltransferase family 39 protein [Anaerolineae bacterium]